MPTLPSSRDSHRRQPKVAAHECELERVAIPAHPQRDAAAGAAEDAADGFLEGESRCVRTVDTQDHVAGLDPSDAGGAGDGAANEQAARPRQHHHTDAAVASDIRTSRGAVLRRSEEGRVAVVQRSDQPGHRRLREHRLREGAVVPRGKFGAHLLHLGAACRAARDRSQRQPDTEGRERCERYRKNRRPPHGAADSTTLPGDPEGGRWLRSRP